MQPQGILAAPATGGGQRVRAPQQQQWQRMLQHAQTRAERARAQARAARRLRQRKLRAVVAAAAEVGVVVKMLPVVEWQKWYHEMLA